MLVTAYKPYGMTPKELVDLYIKLNPKYKKGCFCGRLDPMAHGSITLLFNEECKNMEKYLKTDKTYIFTMGVGITTESMDVLGFVEEKGLKVIDKDKLQTFLSKISINYVQKLPERASFCINKKPLWLWTQEGRINEINIPTFERKINHFAILKESETTLGNIAIESIRKIKLIDPKHTFNQDLKISTWEKMIDSNISIPIIQIMISVSSGFYIRELVADIGKELNISTLTLDIYRP
jgi:tRNA U55 pseudouridine synthase TruB